MLQGLLDGILRNLIKGNSLYLAVSVLFQLQCLGQMPGDGLSLAIRVRCEIDVVCFLDLLAESGQHISLSPDGDVLRFVIILRIKAQLAFGKIPHMSAGGVHGIVGSQEFFYCFHLCR